MVPELSGKLRKSRLVLGRGWFIALLLTDGDLVGVPNAEALNNEEPKRMASAAVAIAVS